MKKLLLFALVGLFIFGCKKSNDDPNPDPDPKPVENYIITYSFAAFGLDTLDYIKYLDATGTELMVSNTSEFIFTFKQPKNKINAKMVVKGSTGSLFTAYADYQLLVTDSNDNVIHVKKSSTDGANINFNWNAEYKNIEN